MRDDANNVRPDTGKQGGPVEWGFFAVALVLAVAFALWLSANKLMWNDEFLSFYTDGVASFRDVVRVQLHTPISLDPPTYHLLSHAAMDVLGRSALALRMPAMVGFVLMELSLFAVVRRWSGARAAVVAMLFPLMTATARYSAEGRPYGLLLGMYALAFACWYAATREARRVWWLVGLAGAIVMAITSHYFGVLLLVPLVLAEIVRSVERRRMDGPMSAAIACGMVSVGIVVPFQKAVAPYRLHYYSAGTSVRQISQAYRELFVNYFRWPLMGQRWMDVAMVLGVSALLIGVIVVVRRRAADGVAVWVFAGTLVCMPVYGYAFAKVVTHTMVSTYVMPAVIGFAVLVAVALRDVLRKQAMFVAVCVGMVVVAGVVSFETVATSREEMHAEMAALVPSAEVRAALDARPNAPICTPSCAPIYVQMMGVYFIDSYYTPDAAMRERFVFLYDGAREVKWKRHDTFAISAENLKQFAPLRTESYDDFSLEKQALVVATRGDWEWLPQEFAATGVPVERVGTTFYGELWDVQPAQAKRSR